MSATPDPPTIRSKSDDHYGHDVFVVENKAVESFSVAKKILLVARKGFFVLFYY